MSMLAHSLSKTYQLHDAFILTFISLILLFTAVARFDLSSLWDVVESNSNLPATPNVDTSLFCPPWPLMKTDDEAYEVVTSGNTITNWDADTFVEQYDNGRFVIRRGFPDRKETILFDNELDLATGDYFTKLRGNGDLLTFRGTPDDHDDESVWKIDSDYPEGQYFLGVECDLGTVSIYEFIPEDPGDQLWSTNGTDWVPDGSTLPPIGSAFPSSSPTGKPSSSPTVSAAPSSEMEIETASPSAADTMMPFDADSSMPSSAPSKAPITQTQPAPGVVANGGSFCTPTAPCPMCYGDCDVSTNMLPFLSCNFQLLTISSSLDRRILIAKVNSSARSATQMSPSRAAVEESKVPQVSFYCT